MASRFPDARVVCELATTIRFFASCGSVSVEAPGPAFPAENTMMSGSAAAAVPKSASRTMRSWVRATAEYPCAPLAPVNQLLFDAIAPFCTESRLSVCHPPVGGQGPQSAFCATRLVCGATPRPHRKPPASAIPVEALPARSGHVRPAVVAGITDGNGAVMAHARDGRGRMA